MMSDAKAPLTVLVTEDLTPTGVISLYMPDSSSYRQEICLMLTPIFLQINTKRFTTLINISAQLVVR